MKAFKHKPEQIIGECFDGTPESAKKILNWFRDHPASEYFTHHMSLRETRYDLGENVARVVDNVPCLELHATNSRYYLRPGTWLMLTEKNEFKTFRDEHLAEHYNEL